MFPGGSESLAGLYLQQSEATIGNHFPKEVSLCFGQDKGMWLGEAGMASGTSLQTM